MKEEGFQMWALSSAQKTWQKRTFLPSRRRNLQAGMSMAHFRRTEGLGIQMDTTRANNLSQRT